jgi:hypothetical protein
LNTETLLEKVLAKPSETISRFLRKRTDLERIEVRRLCAISVEISGARRELQNLREELPEQATEARARAWAGLIESAGAKRTHYIQSAGEVSDCDWILGHQREIIDGVAAATIAVRERELARLVEKHSVLLDDLLKHE